MHELRLSGLEMKIKQLERERRRNVIIIEGTLESEENPSPEIVEELFPDLKVNLDSMDCDQIYRQGKSMQGTGNGREPEAAANQESSE